MRIVLGCDEVQRLAHEGRAHDGPIVQSAAQILPLEALEPRGERHVRRARTLALERAEAVDRGRNVERDPLEQELACERGAIQLAQGQRLHRLDGTTCCMRRLAILLALLAPASAGASDGALLAAKERYLPAVQAGYANTPDGAQARYDAGRDLVEAVLAAGPVSPAAGRSAPTCSRAAGPRWRAPRLSIAPTASAARAARTASGDWAGYGLRRLDAALAVGSLPWPRGRRAPSVSGSTSSAPGGMRATNRTRASRPPPRSSSARSPPACAPRPAPSAAVGGTTSARSASGRRTSPRTGSPASLGYAAIGDGLRRLGMTSSTYPGPYRATTAWRPPGAHTRVTTARDLGRALYRLHTGAHGNTSALQLLGFSRRQAIVALRVLASAQPVGDNAGLLRPWLAGATVAEKNGWLSDTRTTATIVYDGGRATIVVVELYRPGVTYARGEAAGTSCLAGAGLLPRACAFAATPSSVCFSSLVERAAPRRACRRSPSARCAPRRRAR